MCSLILSAVCLTDAPTVLPAREIAFAFDPTAGGVHALAMSPQNDAQAPPAPPLQIMRPLPAYGDEGSRYWYVNGGFAEEIDFDGNQFGLLGVGYDHFIADGVSIALELNGIVVNQEIEDAAGINFNLLVRWHFVRHRNWSLFLDGGAGLLLSTNDIPANGSSFNFTPQAGAGMTFKVTADIRLMAGVRWHHISNANIYESNPGRDSLFGYLGVIVPF